MKKGYKDTEIGTIPESWTTPVLGDLFSFKNGLNKSKYFFGHGTPIVNYMDVYQHSSLCMADIKGRVEVTKQEQKAYEVKRGDVFFTRTSETVEEVGLTSVMLDDPSETVFSGFVLRARPKNACLDDKFKKYCFSPRYVRSQITSQSSYTTRALTNGKSLSSVIIAKPTPAEQKVIATVLGDFDDLIGSLDDLITKKRNVKLGAMQRLLAGNTRIPGFSSKWKLMSLGQMGKCYRGVSYNPSTDLALQDTASTVRLLRSNNIQNGKVEFSDVQYVDSGRVSAEQYLRASDIVVCMANGSRDLVGKAGQFMGHDESDYTFGAFMGCFRPNGQTSDANFVFCLFQTEEYRSHIGVLLAGSSINNLTPGSVESFTIRVPSEKPEQAAIAAVLSDMDTELSGLEQRLQKIRALKQGTMRELLTGSIRLL